MKVFGRRLRVPGWSRPLFAIPVVVAVGWWTHAAIEARIRARVSDSIEAAMRADRTALQFWIRDQGRFAGVIASDQRVADATAELLDVSRRHPGDAAALRASAAQAKLRQVVTPLLAEGQDAGWAVLDPGGLVLACAADERVGERAGGTLVEAVGARVSRAPSPSCRRRCASPSAPSPRRSSSRRCRIRKARPPRPWLFAFRRSSSRES